jgi:hypothetical protein
MPGLMGGQKRLLQNIRTLAAAVGPCEQLVLHSAVFDTEATNYFLRALPRRVGATVMQARVIPDGLISVRRYPQGILRILSRYSRKLRRILTPELNYWCFAGDRTGTDAPFVDLIYVLHGLPHQYPAYKVCTLPPLVESQQQQAPKIGTASALVIGQPLVANGILRDQELPALTRELHEFLHSEGVEHIVYKPHPKDTNHELAATSDECLPLDEPLETHMSHKNYRFVVGARSSALLFARQIYPAEVRVIGFGWDRMRFKSKAERRDLQQAFRTCGVEIRGEA